MLMLHCLGLDVYEDGTRVLLVSPSYSVLAEECEMVHAPGSTASIVACLIVFACLQLEGFQIAPPPALRSLLPMIPEADDNLGDSGKGACKGGEFSSDNDASLHNLRPSTQVAGGRRVLKGTPKNSVSSLGPLFDMFGIGQKVLGFSVCGALC
jgi:hypothetical protein